jgi:DNA-binding winged helix-turn-helix (wHTH) protein
MAKSQGTNMAKVIESGRAGQLTVELGSGTAVIDGERIQLPAKEFRLLALLASRPGEAVSAEALINEVWPEESSWMTAKDLYWHIWQLRKLIGDDKRKAKVVGNRRGFGYLMSLAPSSVRVVQGPSDEADLPIGEAETTPADAAEPETKINPVIEPTPSAEVPRQRGSRGVRTPLVAALLVALIALSWGAGFAISRWRSSRSAVSEQAQPPADSQVQDQAKIQRKVNEGDARNRPGGEKRPTKGKRDRSRQPQAPFAAAQPVAQGESAPDAGDGQTSATTNSQRNAKQRDQKVQPSLPPAPTRYLYHLVNSKTGDHFVTTDADVVSSYQGRGYQGGAIARIYTSAEDNTKAITTNRGTAYIFQSSSPKTEPASSTLPLWYATNDKGDFFYTTSESEASADGWRSSLIGYVRSP